MRESNFAFPAQNRASVCISSQLYDRRALDTNSSLPLFNSLTHLAYLTSTSPRIREIMTMDGGLERLVHILHDYCISPTPPENPAFIYGLSPPTSHPPKPTPSLNPKSFDKQAAYRFSLAFQCVVNIGVRGSEPIRSRVVQAGTLEVVGCILEAWLASKGFAIGPSSSASGMPRETREQRLARRQAQAEQRQRDQAAQLSRALQRQIVDDDFARYDRSTPPVIDTYVAQDEPMTDASQDPPSSAASVDSTTSAETSFGTTPVRSITPAGSVTVSVRERSGTIVARPRWDSTLAPPTRRAEASGSTSTDNSRPETETEDDGDVDMDRDRADTSPERAANPPQNSPHTRRAVGIVTDSPPAATTGASLEVNADAHIIINNGPTHGLNEVGVEDGIVSLEPNDDFAMGAPPGAPGAIEGTAPTTAPADLETRPRPGQPDVTPRAVTTDLPAIIPVTTVPRGALDLPRHLNNTQIPTRFRAPRTAHGQGVQHERHPEGPYRDEDVLLSLQLLAYLSKYPHVRQHFYKTRPSFHPATQMVANKAGSSVTVNNAISSPSNTKEINPLFKAFVSATGRGKEKEKAIVSVGPVQGSTMRETNVFSLVERFTFRPSSSESELPNPPPTLPAEIQYWAGVIMRNACRKDESRGGIRQCANMLCGRWETFPREFAKCRRCRKAKYCGKDCQSTAWSEGHRFWCSAKDPEDDGDHHHHHGERRTGDGRAPVITTTTSGGTITGRTERRADRDRQRIVIDADTNGGAQGTGSFRSSAGTDVNTTLVALNLRPPAQNGQTEYLRLLNPRQQPNAESSTASANIRRRAETLAAPQLSQRMTTAPGNTDSTGQQRPFPPGPQPDGQLGTHPGAGPSRRGHSPQDVDMSG